MEKIINCGIWKTVERRDQNPVHTQNDETLWTSKHVFFSNFGKFYTQVI